MQQKSSGVYVACVPHVPILKLQEEKKQESAPFWAQYDARVAEFESFDPELVIVFGADHYSNIRLGMMPSFLVGYNAEAIGDSGGIPGTLDVPTEMAVNLSHDLIDAGIDVATSYAMKVDHGFSNVLNFFFCGRIDARPVIPVFINALAEPRPTLRRCRELGTAIGNWAAKTGKRVAILGSGGLSHSTGAIFPQYHTASSDAVRDFIVHGETGQGITDKKWHDDIADLMDVVSNRLIGGSGSSTISRAWDERFLETLASNDLSRFDDWADVDVVREGGEGASEVRNWIAAAAAGRAAGGAPMVVDYYSDATTLGVGAGVAHAPAA